MTGTKSGFHIDDPRAPTERTLTHTPVETDALTVTYSGNVRTGADGRAVVRLPSYATAIAAGWRYTLTPIGRFGQAIVEREVSGGRFTVRTEHPAHEGVLDRDRPAARPAGAPPRHRRRSPRSAAPSAGSTSSRRSTARRRRASSVARLTARPRSARAMKGARPRLASER